MCKQEDPKKQNVCSKQKQENKKKNRKRVYLSFNADCPTDIGWQV